MIKKKNEHLLGNPKKTFYLTMYDTFNTFNKLNFLMYDTKKP